MAQPIADIAKQEAQMTSYMFEDTIKFTATIVKTLMDESATRPILMTFAKRINEAIPFQLLNDYRLAKTEQRM
jgi:putative effector of murein hydrolase